MFFRGLTLVLITLFTLTAEATPPSKCDDLVCTLFSCHCEDGRKSFANAVSDANEQQHHVKHNMVLVGTEEVFASHIVYKEPHNYQVILQLNFEESVLKEYTEARASFPEEQFILLLDHMDISKIQESTSLSGTLLRRTATGEQTTINAHVHLNQGSFKVLYFDELPLSLSKESQP